MRTMRLGGHLIPKSDSDTLIWLSNTARRYIVPLPAYLKCFHRTYCRVNQGLLSEAPHLALHCVCIYRQPVVYYQGSN